MMTSLSVGHLIMAVKKGFSEAPKDGKGLKPIYFDVASVVSQFAPIHRGRTGRCAGSVNAAAPENVKPGINLAFPMARILSLRSEMPLRIAPPQ
jgi:hypothetical protein